MLSYVVAVLTALAGLTPGPQSGNFSDGRLYANQTPYGNAADSPTWKAPSGYELFFVQTVQRHGSRSATSPDNEEDVLELWEEAEETGSLTTRGKQFGKDLAAFQKAEESIGYGHLSSIGKAELFGIGRRTADNYRGFLEKSAKDGDRIQFLHTPIDRTDESGEAMKDGLEAQVEGLDFAKDRVDEKTLLISSGSTKQGREAIAQTKRRPPVVKAAEHVLETIYVPAFVAGLDDEEKVDAGLGIYLLYQTAPGLAAETSVTFDDYVRKEDAKVLGRVRNAETFYRYGPGVSGQDDSYRKAEPLLDDFFRQLDRRVDGGDTAAVFRMAHGETTMPFTAVIKLRNSDKQVVPPAIYNSDDNPWRAYEAGLLAGGVEWAAYRKGGSVLVTMRQNEQPVRFRSECESYQGKRQFYELSELKRCLPLPMTAK